MTHESIGSLNDYAAESGLDPWSKEAEVGYTALLTENLQRIKNSHATLDSPSEIIITLTEN